MNRTSALERLNQFQRTMWSFDDVKEWFGCDLEGESQRLLAQYSIWASRFDDMTTVLDMSGKLIHRNILELFLQDRELLPIRLAALRWGTDVASFRAILQASLVGDLISEGERDGEFPGVFRKSFITDFYRRFPKLSRFTFYSFSSYIRQLHKEIRDYLSLSPVGEYCATSVALGHELREFGHNFDCITGQPVGLGHQIWLETRKPIQLELDECSWLTMERFFDDLNGSVLGSLSEEFEANREILRRYVDETPRAIF